VEGLVPLRKQESVLDLQRASRAIKEGQSISEKEKEIEGEEGYL